MPIPPMNEGGLLPQGIHPCDLEEVRQRFGRNVLGSSRFDLMERLEKLISEIRRTGLVVWIGVDGSFVTDKESPGDVDLLLVLASNHDFDAELRPMEYNVLSRRRVQKRYGLDILSAVEGSRAYADYEELFRRVKYRPDMEKGFLRIDL